MTTIMNAETAESRIGSITAMTTITTAARSKSMVEGAVVLLLPLQATATISDILPRESLVELRQPKSFAIAVRSLAKHQVPMPANLSAMELLVLPVPKRSI